jgi:RNA ligase (TIGR02306 family)
MTRKLATIRKIDEIRSIEGADAIEAAVVGGWTVVVKKNEFAAGDLAVYLEIDSWVPTELAPFLSKGQEPREYNGVRGERLRTVKLRGQVSQGLLLPMSVLNWDTNSIDTDDIGIDVSDELGIQKYEAPVPAQLAGQVRGNFPGFISKTDQERIQNLTAELREWQDNPQFTWEVTEKLDGSSMTVYVRDEDEGVCSRNLDLKPDEANSFWGVAIREDLIAKIRSTGRNLALQGELIGEGIQKNPYNIRGQDFRLFDIYDIDRGDYMSPLERRVFAETHGIKQVPLIMIEYVIDGVAHIVQTNGSGVQGLLTIADGKSALNVKTAREGLVFKCNTFGGPSFKAISNKWLLNEGEQK